MYQDDMGIIRKVMYEELLSGHLL